MTHVKVYGAVTAVLVILLGLEVLDSRQRNASAVYRKPLKEIAAFLPSADVGMDNSARYVRHLTLATPASAFSDFPAQPDYLPAGMAWAPPPFVGCDPPFAISSPAGAFPGMP